MNKFDYKFSFQTLILFFICFTLISLRNLEPISFPTIYAEDGSWIGSIFKHGFIETALHARKGFPVFGAVSLDWIALKLNGIFSNNNLFTLPIFIWIISNSFIAILSTLPYLVFRKSLSSSKRILLVLFLPLIIVGGDGNEIFGRILNLVFLFPLLSVYCICIYRNSSKGFLPTFFCLFLLLLSAVTFPVSLAILIFWFFLELLIKIYRTNKFQFGKYISNSEPIKLITLFSLGLTIFIALMCMPNDIFSHKGGASNLSINNSGWIDFVGGRLILYPFIAPYYSSFSDPIILLLSLTIIFFVCYSSLKKIRKEDNFVSIFLLGSTFIYITSMAFMRAGFTSVYGNYLTTGPDRYFYGINTLFLILVFSCIFKYARYQKVIFIPFGLMLILSLMFMKPYIFEGGNPLTQWRDFGDLRQMTCNMAYKEVPTKILDDVMYVEIPIYPIVEGFPWKITLPKYFFEYSTKSSC